MLNALYLFTVSPYFTVLLCGLVTLKWAMLLIKRRELGMMGGLLSRLMFFIIYMWVASTNPPLEEIRIYLRAAVQFLFIDELVYWITRAAVLNRISKGITWIKH
jgi:hypothetical protein